MELEEGQPTIPQEPQEPQEMDTEVNKGEPQGEPQGEVQDTQEKLIENENNEEPQEPQEFQEKLIEEGEDGVQHEVLIDITTEDEVPFESPTEPTEKDTLIKDQETEEIELPIKDIESDTPTTTINPDDIPTNNTIENDSTTTINLDDIPIDDSSIFGHGPESPICCINGKKYLKMPWDMPTWGTTLSRFTHTLKHPPHTAADLDALTHTQFFTNIQSEYPTEVASFLHVYPFICALILDTKGIFESRRVPLLQTRTCGKAELTRRQAACLLALSFFGDYGVGGETYNIFTVRQVLAIPCGEHVLSIGVCYLNYLTNVGRWLQRGPECADLLSERVTYMRHSIQPFPLDAQRVPLCPVKVVEQGSLGSSPANYHADFANKFIGGGALQGGCVQEELMFARQPELACAMAFMEVMDATDAIRIDNALCHSLTSGYAATFKFEGNALGEPGAARKGGRVPRVVAMDAVIQGHEEQFDQAVIGRDVHKAFVCFQLAANPERMGVAKDVPATVATGNWGCGAFGGDHELKFVEQWIAASLAGVEELEYYAYQSREMENVIARYGEIREKCGDVKRLYSKLLKCKAPGTVVETLTKSSLKDSFKSLFKK